MVRKPRIHQTANKPTIATQNTIIKQNEKSCWPQPHSEANPSTQEFSQTTHFGCADHWGWSETHKSNEVRLYGSDVTIAHFHPNWSSGTAGVLGTRSLDGRRYYWELEISQRVFGTSIMFGVATKDVRLHADTFTNLLGEDANGWGLSHKGLLWHDGRWSGYTKPFRENQATTIGILYDGVAGTLTYYKDGMCLGVAFRDLNQSQSTLYPFICSTAAKTKMSLTRCRRDFVNLQDRCRDVIVRLVRTRSRLVKLKLPKPLLDYISGALPSSVKTRIFQHASLNKIIDM